MNDVFYVIAALMLIIINHAIIESKFISKFNNSKIFSTSGFIIIDAIIVAIYFIVKYI